MVKILRADISPLEVVIFILFVFYLVFKVKTPETIANLVDTPVGIVIILAITLYLFLKTHPVLAILSIFVAYELIRRSTGYKKTGTVSMIQYTPTQQKINTELVAMNPPVEKTLEEEIVQHLAPFGESEPSQYVMTSFKPISEDVHNASAL
jgi:hypothetical protein